MSEQFLDRLRDQIHRWSESLSEETGEAQGGFRMNSRVGVNLLSSTDVAWIRYAVNDEDVGGSHHSCGSAGQAWVNYLRARQDPQTGRYAYHPSTGVTLTGPAVGKEDRACSES